jgi:transposase
LESRVLTDRVKFMLQWDMLWEVTEGRVNVAELCREFAVSRKTAYKWRKRWDPADPGSLADRSRRPDRHPSQTPERTEDVIVEYRKKWPSWGPKKLHTVLSRTYEVGVPSVATIGRILKRRGLIVDSRRRRSKTPRFSAPFEGCNAPNDVWSSGTCSLPSSTRLLSTPSLAISAPLSSAWGHDHRGGNRSSCFSASRCCAAPLGEPRQLPVLRRDETQLRESFVVVAGPSGRAPSKAHASRPLNSEPTAAVSAGPIRGYAVSLQSAASTTVRGCYSQSTTPSRYALHR